MFFLLRTSQFQATIDARDRKMKFDVKKRDSTGENNLKEKEIIEISQERRRKCISGQRPRNQ